MAFKYDGKEGVEHDRKCKQDIFDSKEYVCIIWLHNANAKKIKTFLVIISAWNLRSCMHISTCYICLYIASVKKNLTVCCDGSSRHSITDLDLTKPKSKPFIESRVVPTENKIFFSTCNVHTLQVLNCINDLTSHALTITRNCCVE